MPYLISLGNRYGHTTDYAAVAHPSLPNYLAISGGSTFAVNDDDDPSSHPISGTSVFASGGKSYEQSMPNNCELSDADPYAARHNPLTYFTGERSLCEQNDLPLSALPADLSRGLPNVSMLTPDVDHDAHDGSLGEADAFLKTWIPRIMDGADYKAGRLAIVVTFDEGDSSSQTVYTAVMSPSLHSETVNAGLSHYSLAHWLYRVAGLPPQRLAATAPDLGSAFGL